MPVAAVFASHSPLKDFKTPEGDVAGRVDACLADVRAAVADWAPELVICFGPDHYNGFFYRLMPPFCIGTAAESVGDWATPSGEIPVAGDQALACVRHLHDNDIDVSLSHRMEVDHGMTQLLMQLFDWQALPQILPIFVNCAATPLPPIKRVIALGECIGDYIAELETRTQLRILVTASGGLSHDPPIPQLASAPEAVRKRLIEGGPLSPAARAARQDKVLADADAQVTGDSSQRELNPEWDERFLSMFANADYGDLLNSDDAKITEQAGCGGHEVRTWIAARATLSRCTQEKPSRNFYAAIPAWVAGFGLASAGLGLSAEY